MSLIPIAAELIRRAANDENYAIDLDAAVADPAIFSGLVEAPIAEDELGCLALSEWQWFASWRQALGGPLDERVLAHLTGAASNSRSARFELRGLVMRDPHTEEHAASAGPFDPIEDVPGLHWLRAHARDFPDSEEVTHDALQFATEGAWFALRVLTAPEHPHSQTIRALLRRFADVREIDAEIAARWVAEPAPTPEVLPKSAPATETRPARLLGTIGKRLTLLADSLSSATTVVGVKLAQIEVLGDDDDSIPIRLILPDGAEQILVEHVNARAVAGGGAVRVWISGTWIPAAGSRLVLHAVDASGEILTDEATVPPGRGRLKFVLDWTESEPPSSILLAVFAP